MPHDYKAHPRGIWVRVEATASRLPGRSQPWIVEAGYWRAEATTEKAAADALTTRLRDFLTHYRQAAVLSFRGYTAVVTLELGDEYRPVSWTQRIVAPDGRIHHCGHGAETWEQARAFARHNLAQVSTDWHDDASVQHAAAFLDQERIASDDPHGPDEFYRYASWQRAARAAMHAGRRDWHE